MQTPNFDNILKILQCGQPERPTLFEFFLNDRLYRALSGVPDAEQITEQDTLAWSKLLVRAFENAGYDYATIKGSDFCFPVDETALEKTRSLNDGNAIASRADFEAYLWQNPDDCDYSRLEALAPVLPSGMKLIIWSDGGVLENVIKLVGYETLCYLIFDEPELVQDVFDAVGAGLLRYYENCAQYDTVGALIVNDDWGFNTQTMLAPEDMRRYVFPWHKRIVAAIHKAGKPAILHSCGNLQEVMEDIIEDMRYDGKHSYEDNILPVEQAYERWRGRIAILGGMDLDFVCRSTPELIFARSKAMLERVALKGGYALGTGNSVPYYIPDEQYFAMTDAVLKYRTSEED